MKIQFDNVVFGNQTGPNSFATRLAQCLIESGHDIVASGAEADASLVFIERTGAPLSKIVVQRLDGIWFKPSDFKIKNVNIKSLYESADHVIWQSEFDKQMITHHWGPRSGTTIHNGINASPAKELTFPELQRIRSQYDHVFVCSSNWHPQKRLRSNIEMFDHLRKNGYTNSCLFILGSSPDVRAVDQHIFYAGSQPHEVCKQIYAMSNWMIHLAYLDHCPNVVIEAMSQGTPVIHSNQGGTREIVKQFGVELIEANDYGFELLDYDNPPTIDVKQILKLPKKDELGAHGDIDIVNVAKKYIKVFESLT